MALIQMDYMAESIQRWTTSWVLFPIEGSNGEKEEEGSWTAVILLHDDGGNHTDFVTKYNAFKAGSDSGLILIMPDGDNSGYRNWPVYGANYETYIAKELPALMRRAFPIGEGAEHLCLMGEGKGGEAALLIGRKYPDVFGLSRDLGHQPLEEALIQMDTAAKKSGLGG